MHQRHVELRPWTHPIIARRGALAGCSSAGAVQGVQNSPLMPAAQGTTVSYMTDCCVTGDIAHWQHLQSAGCYQLLKLRHRRSTFGRRAFSVADQITNIQDPSRSYDIFRRGLKTFLFSFY